MKPTAFERLMGGLDHPMVVVTAASRRAIGGCLVGFSTQCSLDPPRYCVFLSKANHTYEVARKAGHLMVHFLDHRQHDLAALFGEHSAYGPADGTGGGRGRRRRARRQVRRGAVASRAGRSHTAVDRRSTRGCSAAS